MHFLQKKKKGSIDIVHQKQSKNQTKQATDFRIQNVYQISENI